MEPVSLPALLGPSRGVWSVTYQSTFAGELAVSEWERPSSRARKMWTTSSPDEEVGEEAPRKDPGGDAGPPAPRRNGGSRGASAGITWESSPC